MRAAAFALMAVWAWAACSPAPRPPRLAVVLVVDQMRADYLERFGASFEGGLRRLLDEGTVFEQCHFGHAMTGTAPGHASLSTGCDPRSHGVFEQVWFDKASRREVRFTEDTRHRLLGRASEPGVSPHRMRRDTVGDWLKASSPTSKVFAVAIKARAAVSMGGHRPDGAYWYDPDLPGALSSSYYMDGLPDWVSRFNALDLLTHFQLEGWSPLFPGLVDALCREDAFAAENDGVDTSFPHRFDEDIARQVRSSPHGDDLTLRFAERLVAEEELGQDEHPDLLWVGLSAADYVGHLYGPFSHEVQDYYLRLDQYLGRFLSAMDAAVGTDEYVVFLTSDHGVAPTPEHSARGGRSARRVVQEEYQAEVAGAIATAGEDLGLERSPLQYANYEGVWIDFDLALAAEISPEFLIETVSRRLAALPFIELVYGPADLTGPRPVASGKPHVEAYWRSYSPGRGPDLMFCFPEHWLVATYPGGTNHGTPYGYDTHVPWIARGRGIGAGRVTESTEPIDLAPTLARLLRIEPPAEIDGQSRLPLLRR